MLSQKAPDSPEENFNEEQGLVNAEAMEESLKSSITA